MTDRDENGRFKKGTVPNPKGRPTKEREVRYRDILLSSVSFTDWQRIVEKARDQALKGDAVARKWLADYFIGPPQQRIDLTTTGKALGWPDFVKGSPDDSTDPGASGEQPA